MKNVSAIHISGKYGFTAYLINGESEADPFWVCVGSDGDPADRGWQGCWSRAARPTRDDITEFLRQLALKLQQNATSGPFGPWLGGTYFFEGWDSWGAGIPEPMKLSVKEVKESAETVILPEDYQPEI